MADMKRYILINDSVPPMIETVFSWDGVTPYQPPVPTWTYEEQVDVYAQQAGSTFVDGVWVPPAPLPEEPV